MTARSGLLTGVVVLASLALVGPSAAAAAGPSLRITNLGQATAPVVVAQPPVEVAATNGCAHPFTLANQGACPPGTWPALGVQWGPIVDIAGGDSLRLEFGAPVHSVTVGATSNYEPGLHDPDGRAISNFDVIAEAAAAATADPAVWEMTLPPLDVRAISSHGYTFSVAAADGTGSHGYPLGIRAPRYEDELSRCGQAWYSTGLGQYLCLSQGGPHFPAPVHAGKKRRRCKKGFRKRKVGGRYRCVRVKKQSRKPGRA
jgi:hypothetical protein